jgi:hypothetical protein
MRGAFFFSVMAGLAQGRRTLSVIRTWLEDAPQ